MTRARGTKVLAERLRGESLKGLGAHARHVENAQLPGHGKGPRCRRKTINSSKVVLGS